MDNPFSQCKDNYKVYFNTNYASLEIFEQFDLVQRNNTSCYEVKSQTIDSMPDDIWCLEIYLDHNPDLSLLRQQISQFIAKTQSSLLSAIEIEKIKDQDWVAIYQQQLKTIEIGRFCISARSQVNSCPEHKINIAIDSTRAFGTGEHQTTAGCIESLEQLSHLKFNKILDLGTGTGILAFAAAHIWSDARIYGCDIEQVAIDIAKENAKFNNSRAMFFQNQPSEPIKPLQQEEEEYDLIISNILARPLIHLAKEIRDITSSKAYLVLSGFLRSQFLDVLNAYQQFGFGLVGIIYRDSTLR